MPSVFTLEGPDLSAFSGGSAPMGQLSASGSGMTVVAFPAYGSPLAPTGTPIGPARPETPVFGPGGTPMMYRRQYPARGPVCDYCDPTDLALGDAASFLDQRSFGTASAIVVGGAVIAGALLGGFAVWTRRRASR